MPKSKNRKSGKAAGGKGPSYGGNIGKPSSGMNRIALLGAAVLVIGGAAYWWQSGQNEVVLEDEFAALIAAGQPALGRVRTPPVQGNGHLNPGETKNYAEPFPTSGDHAAQGVSAGFYTGEKPKTGLVHALEHGNVVIYYDTPGDEAVAMLREWTGRFNDTWSGLVVTKSPGLGEALVLTAWAKSLRLNSFDASEAAAFVDAYRGRGPENAVR